MTDLLVETDSSRIQVPGMKGWPARSACTTRVSRRCWHQIVASWSPVKQSGLYRDVCCNSYSSFLGWMGSGLTNFLLDL